MARWGASTITNTQWLPRRLIGKYIRSYRRASSFEMNLSVELCSCVSVTRL